MSLGPEDNKLSLRQYLLYKTLEGMGQGRGGVTMSDYMIAAESVSSTALAHPDWDMDARQEWAQWEKWAKKEKIRALS